MERAQRKGLQNVCQENFFPSVEHRIKRTILHINPVRLPDSRPCEGTKHLLTAPTSAPTSWFDSAMSDSV